MTWIVTDQTRFYLHDGESLLDGLLRTGHDVNYQCKEGYCGSCRLRVQGSSHAITYQQPPLAMLAEDELLPCCCQVQGVVKLSTQQSNQHGDCQNSNCQYTAEDTADKNLPTHVHDSTAVSIQKILPAVM